MNDEVMKKDVLAVPSTADADHALMSSHRAYRRVLASWACDTLVLRKSGHLSMTYRVCRNDNDRQNKAA